MANIVFDFLHNYQRGERRESEPATVYQYDEGHVLEAILPEVITSAEIHYWIRGMETADAYVPTSITPNGDNSCTVLGNIPNKYFETNGELWVYIVVNDESASITTYEGKLHICQRFMPDDYVDDDPENEATRILTEARAAATTATAAAETAQDVADSIPADYSQLSDDVDTLKEDYLDIDDRVTTLEQGGTGGGLTEDIKAALLQMARKVVYVDDQGQTYYDDLHDALYAVTAIRLNTNSIMLTSIGSTQQLTAATTPAGGTVTWASSDTGIATVSNTGLVTSVGYGSCTVTASSGSVSATCAVAVSQATLTSISADYQQSGTVYDTASLDSLKDDLTVTATYSDSSTATVTEYTLSGTLTAGTSTITVSYGGKTTTFTVTVTAAPTLTSISAVYTQSGTVYDTDTLDSLKSDLVVTAHMSDSTTQTVTNYVLSGTLTVGTSTITVTYGGKTTTFNVTVTTILVTYTQGSIGSGSTAKNRVSGVITSGIHLNDDETLVITIASGYSIYPFGINCHSTESRAGTKASENVLWTYCVSDGGDVFASINDMTGTFTANGKNIKNGPSVGWQTSSVTYVYTPSAQDGLVIKGLGFLVKKNDDSNITPSDVEQIIQARITGASS